MNAEKADERERPLISIITPSFNQASYIEQTIRSVLDQTYPNVQHIVVDGGSTDGTVDILKRYPHLIWISEKDRGQADALNKGLELATGALVGWINSDDYYQRNIFVSVAEHFRSPSVQWVVGNLADVFDDGSLSAFRRSPEVSFDSLIRNPDIVRQQPTFFRRDALITAGGWNAELYMVMDFDLWLRLAKRAPPVMTNGNWAFYRTHAAQKSGLRNILRQASEIAAVLDREDIPRHLIAAHRHRKLWYWMKGLTKSRMIDLGLIPQRYRTRPIRSPD